MTPGRRHFFAAYVPEFVIDAACVPFAGGVAYGTGYAYVNHWGYKPNKYLVRTGRFIQGVLVTQSGIRWPGQKATVVTLDPDSNKLSTESIYHSWLEPGTPHFRVVAKDNGSVVFDNEVYRHMVDVEALGLTFHRERNAEPTATSKEAKILERVLFVHR